VILGPRIREQADHVFIQTIELSGDMSSSIDRLYGYTAMTQLSYVVVDFLNAFVPLFISFLLRDFDSQDLSITNALRNILKSVEKRSRAEQCQTELASLFLRAIENLSWHSKLKSWLLPKVIQYDKSSQISVFS
jgi:hypothetical protein